AVVRNHDAVGAFPHRNFADVADQQVAFAVAGGRDGHAAQILIASGGDESKILADFFVHFFFGDANAGAGSHVENAHVSGVADDGNLIDRNFLVAFDENLALVVAKQAPLG